MGTAEREHALEMLKHVRRRHELWSKTMGFDAGYDDSTLPDETQTPGYTARGGLQGQDQSGELVVGEARRRVRRRMCTKGYQISQRIHKRIEQIIGWGKDVGCPPRTRFLGHKRMDLEALITGAAYNLLRLTRHGHPPTDVATQMLAPFAASKAVIEKLKFAFNIPYQSPNL